MDPRDADLLFNNILFTLYLFVLYGTKFYKKRKKKAQVFQWYMIKTDLQTLKQKELFFRRMKINKYKSNELLP